MRIKIAVIAAGMITLAVCCNVPAGASAGRGPGRNEKSGYGRRGEGMGRKSAGSPDAKWKHLAEKLDLSPEQQEQLRSRRRSERETRAALRDEGKQLMNRLREELGSDEPDPGRIAEIIDASAENHRAMLSFRAESVLGFRSILTEEQWEKVSKMKMHRMDAK